MVPLLDFFMRMGEALRDLAFPPLCLACERRHTREGICRVCRATFPRVPPHALAWRRAQLPPPVPLDRLWACWYMASDTPLQRVHHLWKYGNMPFVGTWLAPFVAEQVVRDWPMACVDMLVPMPLHRRRYVERGYNQSAWLARGLGTALGLPVVEDTLVRHRYTASQTHLSRAARWENVRDAFRVRHPEVLTGRRVVLVDDLLTTGATAYHAAGVLKAHGAHSVWLLTLSAAR